MSWTRTLENSLILSWITAVLFIAYQLGCVENGWKEFIR